MASCLNSVLLPNHPSIQTNFEQEETEETENWMSACWLCFLLLKDANHPISYLHAYAGELAEVGVVAEGIKVGLVGDQIANV